MEQETASLKKRQRIQQKKERRGEEYEKRQDIKKKKSRGGHKHHVPSSDGGLPCTPMYSSQRCTHTNTLKPLNRAKRFFNVCLKSH